MNTKKLLQKSLSRLLAAAAIVSASFGIAESAQAQQVFPGTNGRLLIDTATSNASSARNVRSFSTTGSAYSLASPGTQAVASPDGTKVAYASPPGAYSNRYEIRLAAASGAGSPALIYQKAYTSTTEEYVEDLRYSPDGKHLAFTTWAEPYGYQNLYVIEDIMGLKTVRRLTSNDRVFSFAWTENSKQVAYTSRRDGDYEVYVQNRTGSGLQQLTNDTADQKFVRWHPTACGMLYTSGSADTLYGVSYNRAADGTLSVTGFGLPYGYDVIDSLEYLPNGAGFVVLAKASSTAVNPTLVTVNWANGSLTRKNSGISASGVVSPDGKKLAYTNNVGEVWIANLDGTAKQRVATGGLYTWGKQ